MTTRDIAESIQEMVGAQLSHSLISGVNEAVMNEVKRWQSRPLASLYPILYRDGMVVKVHHNKRVIKKTVYLALGINQEGCNERLGLSIAETKGASFWPSNDRATVMGRGGYFCGLC